MGKLQTNWLLPGHSGRACRHDNVYTKQNKKTGAVYSVKLCNPSTKAATQDQVTVRYGFAQVSKVISKWIKDNKENPTTDYNKVVAAYNRQRQYATLRGYMIGKGMYTVDSDMEVTVNINAKTVFSDAFPTTGTASSGGSSGGAVNGDLPGFGG